MKNKQIYAQMLLIALLLPLLTGCWSRREIESLGFATLVSLDLGADERIEICSQFALTAAFKSGGSTEGETSTEAPVWTVCTSADNIAEAIEQVRTFAGKYPFWSQADMMIFGEDLAKQGLAPIVDYFMRNRDFRFSTWLLISENPKEMLQIPPVLSQMPAEHIRQLHLIAKENSLTAPRSALNFLQVLLEEAGSSAILPLLTTHAGGDQASPQGETAEEEGESLAMQGFAVFRGDKLAGKLNPSESRALLWLRGESKRGNVVVDVPGQGYVVQRQIFARRILKIETDGEGVKAKVIIHQDGDLVEYRLPGQAETKEETLQELDSLLTAHIKSEAEALLNKLQLELQADAIGIGDLCYRLHPNIFKTLDWPSYFAQMPVEIEVHANFRRTGETLRTLEAGRQDFH